MASKRKARACCKLGESDEQWQFWTYIRLFRAKKAIKLSAKSGVCRTPGKNCSQFIFPTTKRVAIYMPSSLRPQKYYFPDCQEMLGSELRSLVKWMRCAFPASLQLVWSRNMPYLFANWLLWLGWAHNYSYHCNIYNLRSMLPLHRYCYDTGARPTTSWTRFFSSTEYCSFLIIIDPLWLIMVDGKWVHVRSCVSSVKPIRKIPYVPL